MRCTIVPPHILERIVMSGDSEVTTLPNLLGSLAVYRFQRVH